ncbi:SDR family oxidoreductase [Pseudokineococcus sp. 5B2Z-1]|uniref:SDR family oxidoreductase n=1 Tax=Pseudokineococcus sp. 5B2Z-1 TaxID=3132744 RepID=UPI0030B5FF22
MDGFDGRTVLVTGAAGGIGGTIVRRLVAAGADVVASARKAADLEALVAETGCRTAPCDLTSEEEVQAALEGLDLDGVVSCAGFGGEIATPMETDMAVFDAVMAANARSVMLVTKHASRGMVARGRGGAIVNVSSQAALVALDNHVSYAASKAAVDSITRVSALELGRHGIRVNGVHPTVVMTEMSAFYWGRPEVGGPFLEQMPLGRWATEDDVAGPVLFLLSDAAAMVTGIALPVDGGYTCR